MKKASWFNHILCFDRQNKPRNYLKHVTFNLLNMSRCNWKWFRLETILNNIDIKKDLELTMYKLGLTIQARNYLKHVTFRTDWKWFRLETILNNIDMKKASWFNHILSLGREYKHRNYLKNVTLTLLNMNRGNWKWFRLETILNNIDMKKASWVNHVISFDRQYKLRNYLKKCNIYLT